MIDVSDRMYTRSCAAVKIKRVPPKIASCNDGKLGEMKYVHITILSGHFKISWEGGGGAYGSTPDIKVKFRERGKDC